MQFNSLNFLIFLSIVVPCFFLLRTVTQRSLLLLIASLVFYSWNRPEYLLVLSFSTCLDYFLGLRIGSVQSSQTQKRIFLFFSLLGNLLCLGFFKYAGLFSFSSSFQSFSFFDLALPIGLSFYTFQSMSYSIDVYRGVLLPEKSFIRFFLYISFFPQLVAGPIEKAKAILPQLKRLDQIQQKPFLHLFVWGFFKKLVVADQIDLVVSPIFQSPDRFHPSMILLALLLFTIQIYCDFSAYTDIARGLGRIFGIELMENFKFPLFTSRLSDFWRQWHISLSQWFLDYVYLPMGGSHRKVYFNLMLVFFLSGLWHGGSWWFALWGLAHGTLVCIEKLTQIKPGIIYLWVSLSLLWIPFRAPQIVTNFSSQQWNLDSPYYLKGPIEGLVFAIFMFFAFEFLSYKGINLLQSRKLSVQSLSYTLLGLGILCFGQFTKQAFIYFQF